MSILIYIKKKKKNNQFREATLLNLYYVRYHQHEMKDRLKLFVKQNNYKGNEIDLSFLTFVIKLKYHLRIEKVVHNMRRLINKGTKDKKKNRPWDKDEGRKKRNKHPVLPIQAKFFNLQKQRLD